MLLGKGVGAAFTAVAPKHVGTTLVLWLEFEATQSSVQFSARHVMQDPHPSVSLGRIIVSRKGKRGPAHESLVCVGE